MNKEEIQEALKIIKEPITVNSIEYKYFTQENYDKLLRVYENCQQFVDFYEHFEQHLKFLEEENQQLKKQKADVVEYIKKYLHEHVIDDLPNEESKFETENGIPIPNAKEILLRMLGEIDE